MSSARERRTNLLERNETRVSFEDLVDKYTPIFEEILNTLVGEVDSECSCDECSCSNAYDPIGDRVSRRALDSIKEVTNRWAEDPNFDSDDAMDCICNVIEGLDD